MRKKFACFAGSLLLIGLLAAEFAPRPRAAKASEHLPTLRGHEAVEHLKQQGLYNSLAEAMAAARYNSHPLPSAKAYQFSNPANDFRATFTSSGMSVVSANSKRDRELVIELIGYGYGSRLQAASDGTLGANQNRIENQRGELTEWFVNSAEGIEHGFMLPSPPSTGRNGAESLRVQMEIGGDFEPRLDAAGQTVTFACACGDGALTYDKLRVYDARKREVAARFELEGRRLAIVVDDREAEYPLTIDPLLAQQAKLTASDGAANDRFGTSVAIDGNTAVIGARLDDVVAVDQGSAYVFVRNGTIWSQQARLNSTDGAVSDQFGYSVAISGNTVVVGAAADTIGANQSQGSAYVFVRSGTMWSQQQ